MITQEKYSEYIGVTAPSNFQRLEYLSKKLLNSIIVNGVPTSESLIYKDYINAIMEQIYYFDLNPELIRDSGSSGYTLGSYSEGAKIIQEVTKSTNRISPVAYDILLDCGLLYCGMEVDY